MLIKYAAKISKKDLQNNIAKNLVTLEFTAPLNASTSKYNNACNGSFH